LRRRGARLRVEIEPTVVRYELHDAETAMQIRHNGELVELQPGRPVQRAIELVTASTPRPTQPAGRAPERAD